MDSGSARRHCDRGYDDRLATGRSDFSNRHPNQQKPYRQDTRPASAATETPAALGSVMSHSQVISLADYRRRREQRRQRADLAGHYGEVYTSAAAFVTAISLGTLLMMMRGPAEIADTLASIEKPR